ncbi:hypothetical protein PilKf_02618 [Pillotina sp. SPG140]
MAVSRNKKVQQLSLNKLCLSRRGKMNHAEKVFNLFSSLHPNTNQLPYNYLYKFGSIPAKSSVLIFPQHCCSLWNNKRLLG